MKQLSLPAQVTKTVWQESWSQLWGHLQLWGGFCASAFAILGEVLNDNGVKNAADALHLDPRITLAIAVLGVVTLMARSHKNA